MSAAPLSSRTVARPRIWVPGVLYVDPATTLHIGPHAGIVPSEEHVDQWQCEVHLVVKASLDEAMRKAAGMQLPEEVIDAVAAPVSHRLALRAELVAVRPPTFATLIAAGAQGYVVRHDRTDGTFGVRREGPGRSPAELSHRLSALTTREIERATLAKDPDAAESLHEAMLDGLIDRLLRHVSDGTVDESSVVLALELALAIEPTFFTPPSRSSRARLRTTPTTAVPALEALASQIVERGREHEATAAKIADALTSAAPDVDLVSIPVYETARRLRIPALTLVTRAGEPFVSLPAYTRWVVEEVEHYEPDIPPVLSVRASLIEAKRETRTWRLTILMLVVLAVLAVGIFFVLRGR
jgi:hypothetical protein